MKNRLQYLEPIEEVRAFWNQRPCNIKHSPKTPGTREYFDEVEARKYFVEPHILAFAEFPRWNNKKVLEIGCGIGTDTINFARHGAFVTAVDLSENSLDLTRKRVALYGFEHRVRIYQANAEELSKVVPVEKYDLVYSFGVLHHTPHPERAFEEIREYMRPASTLKVMVYHRRSWKVFSVLLKYGKGKFWQLDEIVARHSEAQTGCPVTYTYTKKQAEILLNNHGFEITEIFVDHIFPYRVEDYVQYRYIKTFPVRCFPDPVFRALERSVGWHLCLTARLKEKPDHQ
jgi:2-polyprenyl-3-methyl-5-hydroxy-6-metoxy-1,4-benzoquinol methylase